MHDYTSWRYVDQRFPYLASYDEICVGDGDSHLKPISPSRTLIADVNMKLDKINISGKQTLEFWVSIKCILDIYKKENRRK